MLAVSSCNDSGTQYNSASVEYSAFLLLQNRAVVNLFRGPNLIDDVAITLKQLERGDLKLRVRSLEAERALTRVEVLSPSPSQPVSAYSIPCVSTAVATHCFNGCCNTL